jgi:protein-S-isoprenylcysteine O-methyltransferase Ste14
MPYIISNLAVLILLSISLFNKPQDVKDNWITMLVSILGSNLSIFVGCAGINLMGTNLIEIISVIAGLLSLAIVPFYFTSVLTLGKNLTVLPEANNLKITGVYRISRHPLYLSYISWYILQIFVAQSLIVFFTSIIQIGLQLIRAKIEEGILTKNFPEYQNYKGTVGWFFNFGKGT